MQSTVEADHPLKTHDGWETCITALRSLRATTLRAVMHVSSRAFSERPDFLVIDFSMFFRCLVLCRALSETGVYPVFSFRARPQSAS